MSIVPQVGGRPELLVCRRGTAGVALLPRWPAIQLVSDVVKGVEALGATIMVNGGLLALDDYALSMVRLRSVQKATLGSAGGRDRRSSSGLEATLTAPSSARLSSVRPWKAWPCWGGWSLSDRAQLFSSSRDRRDLVPFGLGLWRCSHGGRRFGVGLRSYRRILAFAVWNSSSVIAPEAFNSASLASSSALSWGLAASWT